MKTEISYSAVYELMRDVNDLKEHVKKLIQDKRELKLIIKSRDDSLSIAAKQLKELDVKNNNGS